MELFFKANKFQDEIKVAVFLTVIRASNYIHVAAELAVTGQTGGQVINSADGDVPKSPQAQEAT